MSTLLEIPHQKHAESRVATLRLLVAAMRELGVEEWDGIVLGPAPPPPPPKPKQRTLSEQQQITKQWNEYREALEDSRVDGTAAPSEPDEPEFAET
jgi:hypothetical protein